ncbi:MAG: hypothetical protein AAGI15_18065, partial [Pseudomonadota bacterium]
MAHSPARAAAEDESLEWYPAHRLSVFMIFCHPKPIGASLVKRYNLPHIIQHHPSMNRVTQLICRSMLLLALVAASQLSLAQSPSAENPPTVPAPPAAPAADALIDDTASAEEEDAQWMAVFLDGQRAGHVKNVRRVENGQVETSEEFLLRI